MEQIDYQESNKQCIQKLQFLPPRALQIEAGRHRDPAPLDHRFLAHEEHRVINY